jgi:hypothetical protein
MVDMTKLTNQERRELDQIINDSFVSVDELKRFVDYKLGCKLGDITGLTAGMAHVVYELREAAESQGWLGGLIVAVANERPGPRLHELAARFRAAGLAGSEGARLASDLLELANFDLTEIEGQFRNARWACRSTRLTAAAVACIEDQFVSSLRARIEGLLRVAARPKMDLDGFTSTSKHVLAELRKLERTLRAQAALCTIMVRDSDGGDHLKELWAGVQDAFKTLDYDLVLLFFVRPDVVVPEGITILTPPSPAPADIIVWAESVGDSLGWLPSYQERLVEEILNAVNEADRQFQIYELYKQLGDFMQLLRTDSDAVVVRLCAD